MSREPDTHRADSLTLLAALRPDPADQAWDEQARDTMRERILSTAPAESVASRRVFASRRGRFVVALVGAVAITGGGVAVADGRIPSAFRDAFAGWQSTAWRENGVNGADPGTALRVATVPGPDDTVFTVMAAPTSSSESGQADGACTVVLLETSTSARQAGPADFQDVSGSGCQPSLKDLELGERASVDAAYAADSRLGVRRDILVWSASAGDASRAAVETADGRRWLAVEHDGTLYGWLPMPAEGTPGAEIVGYADDGSEVGRVALGF